MRWRSCAAVLVTVLLSSCIQSPDPVPLPFEEVLERAVKKSSVLESARFQAGGTFLVSAEAHRSFRGSFGADGSVYQEGGQIQSAIKAQILSSDGVVLGLVQGEIIRAGANEIYFRIGEVGSATSDFPLDIPMMQGMAGKWWLIPGIHSDVESEQEGTPGTPMRVTPDPFSLEVQAKVVRVARDRGFSVLRERTVYRYDVELDPEKFIEYIKNNAGESSVQSDDELFAFLESLDATGELWIDAESFDIHRVRWSLSHLDVPSFGMVDVDFTMDFTGHNLAPDIELPQGATLFLPSSSATSQQSMSSQVSSVGANSVPENDD